VGEVVEVTSQLTAAVLSVAVAPGSPVAKGDALLVVESMKMEIPILAPVAGTVQRITAAPSDVVAEGDVLAVIVTA
jgi:acetyl-CoA carboxylase biotin carboxyl carrier protein